MNDNSPSVGLVVLQDDERGGVRYIQAYARSKEVKDAPGMKYWLPLEVATGDDLTSEDKGTSYLNAFIKALQTRYRISPEKDAHHSDETLADRETDNQSLPEDRGNSSQGFGFVGRSDKSEFRSPERGSSAGKILKPKPSVKQLKDRVAISFSWQYKDLPLNEAFCNIDLKQNGDLLSISANLPLLALKHDRPHWYPLEYDRQAVLEAVRKVSGHEKAKPEWAGESPPTTLWYLNNKEKQWRLAYSIEGVSDLTQNGSKSAFGNHSMMTLSPITDFVIDAESMEPVTVYLRSRVF
jgi:hypothetical protein